MTSDKSPASPEEETLTASVSTEFALNSLATDVDALIKADRKYIDEALAKKLRREWDTLLKNIDAESTEVKQVQLRFEKLRQRIHDQVELRNQKYAELEQQLIDLKAAIGKDDLQTSQQLEQKIIGGLNKTRGLSSQRQQAIIQGLEALQPRIKKLVSWRHWGTAKAREQVIEEIRNIHDHEKDLEKVARRIKQVREEWKNWDNSGEGGDKKLYKAFDKACSKAYEPCQKLFDSQRKQREAASKHRSAVCDALESYYEKADWRNPEWKEIQQLLREQSGRWRKLGGAEFRDRKPLQKRYDEIIAKFDGPLDRERKVNLKQRRDLIEAVTRLTEQEDNRRAINELQKLKKNWIVTVSGKRNLEQKVWKEFMAACDAIYEKGRESRKAFDAEFKAQLKIKQALCDEIETRLKTDAQSGDQAEEQFTSSSLEAQIRDWRRRWTDSGRAPKADASKIEGRYRDALRKAENRLKDLQAARRAASDQAMFDRAALCAELEAIVLAPNKIADSEKLADIDSRWQALPELEPGLMRALEDRYLAAVNAAADEAVLVKLRNSLNPHFAAVNDLMLMLEINAAVDSPAAYAKQRMALQISRLSAAMGKGDQEAQLSTAELTQRIHTTGALSAEQQHEVGNRFSVCYQALQHDHNQAG